MDLLLGVEVRSEGKVGGSRSDILNQGESRDKSANESTLP